MRRKHAFLLIAISICLAACGNVSDHSTTETAAGTSTEAERTEDQSAVESFSSDNTIDFSEDSDNTSTASTDTFHIRKEDSTDIPKGDLTKGENRQMIDEFGLSFEAPDGLVTGAFDYTDNLYGGVLLNDPENPETKQEDDGTQPAAWITAPGFVGEVHQQLLEFDSEGNPERLQIPVNHIIVTEGPDTVTDTVKPALLTSDY